MDAVGNEALRARENPGCDLRGREYDIDDDADPGAARRCLGAHVLRHFTVFGVVVEFLELHVGDPS